MDDKTLNAVVVRTASDELAYAVTEEKSPKSVSFSPSVVSGFAGQSLHELGITEGTSVSLNFGANGLALRVAVRTDVLDAARGVGLAASVELPRSQPSPSVQQVELLPTDPATEAALLSRALPLETRRFGKILDTQGLKPGDLLLSRDLKPEWTGRAIVSVQEQGGYAPVDARWSHAAMYLGDGAHVVEATFDSVLKGGSVRVTSLDAYAIGEAALRFRRPRQLQGDGDRWRLCVRAMMRLQKPYSFSTAIKMWIRVAVRGGGFFDEDQHYGASDAVICSTLYADAYNEATRQTLGEVGGACVPAWLSGSDQFEDLEVGWLAL